VGEFSTIGLESRSRLSKTAGKVPRGPAKYHRGDRIVFAFGQVESEGRIVGTTPTHAIIDTEGRGEDLIPHGNLVRLAASQEEPRIAAKEKASQEERAGRQRNGRSRPAMRRTHS